MKDLGGIVVPLVTPTDEAGRVRPDRMVDLVEYLGEHVDGYFVRGTSGEYPSLLDDDADIVLQAAVSATDGHRPVIAGVGDTSTPRVLNRLEAVAESGADFVAVTTTFYFEATDAELVRHFTAVADSSPLPILLYRIPQNTHAELTPASMAVLAHHPNVAGMKDSSGDFFGFQEVLAAATPGFTVFQGREQLAAASLLAGADGVISGLANLAPSLLRQLMQAARTQDVDSVFALQREVTHVARVFEEGHWLAVLKAALDAMGVDVGPPVPPLSPLSEDARDRVRLRLQATGIVGGG